MAERVHEATHDERDGRSSIETNRADDARVQGLGQEVHWCVRRSPHNSLPASAFRSAFEFRSE
jgi:hypothetical protein